MPQTPLLEVRGVSKRFPGVQALDNVSLDLYPGEVLAVVGENGAGKSTLMKILAGVYRPDAGTVRLGGREVHFDDAREAAAAGVSLIHQELNLAENLTAAANIFLGREKTLGGPLGWLDRPAMRREAAALMERVGLPGSLVEREVRDLPPGQRQLVEIARALALSARVLIMDEPTSSLTQKETDRLVEVIGELKRAGVSVVYISHRLGEVHRVADRVVVLRDGKNAGELAREQISHDAMVRLMVGRDLRQFYPRTHPSEEELAAAPVRLEVRGLRYRGGPETPVSFAVRGGEVLGMAGLVGAGRTELAEAVFGLRPIVSGEIWLDGRPVRLTHPRRAVKAGVLLVPEDRRAHGLVLAESVAYNLSLPNLDMLDFLRWVVRSRERAMAEDLSARMRVRGTGPSQTVGLLSGGNQQKVVLGKWLARRPRVLILDEPTRGVDVGAKSEIYALTDQLAREGVAVWMISSDMEEVLGMSDRVLVLHEGRLTGELRRGELSEEAVMHLATGRARDRGERA